MSCVYSDDHETAIDVSREDKFFSRLLSKESSRTSPSSRRLYYAGGRGSVPFLWESEPGTPKTTPSRDRNNFSDPPLTPPPSFFLNSHETKEKFDHQYHHHQHQNHLGMKPGPGTRRFDFSRHSPGFPSFQKPSHVQVSRSSSLFSSIFPKKFGIRYALTKLKLRRIFPPFSRSEGDVSESQTSVFRGRRASTSASWFSSSSSTTSFEDEEEVGEGSPKSTLCFFGCYRR